MLACVQRVSQARVVVDGQTTGQIGRGMVVLLGVGQMDDESDAGVLADKIGGLRIFDDAAGKMNLALAEIREQGQAGALLVVSQFTLLADCRKGRRPSFTDAAPPERAEALYEHFVALVRRAGHPVQTGRFRAMMQVELTGDGPVTILLDSAALRAARLQAAGS